MSERGGGGALAALAALAAQLRDEGTPISPHVVDPAPDMAFAPIDAAAPSGEPVASPGPRAAAIEAVREGYLLHYADPRLLAGHDEDLALLAGDYLYALGLERLAAAGDTEAVLVLADLIAASAQLHTEGRQAEASSLWQAGQSVRSLST